MPSLEVEKDNCWGMKVDVEPLRDSLKNGRFCSIMISGVDDADSF